MNPEERARETIDELLRYAGWDVQDRQAMNLFDPTASALLCARSIWSEEIPDGRWRAYSYEEIMARDKVNLDIFWLRDESLEDTDNLPDPDIIAAEIVEDLESALEQFRLIAEDLDR
jgi:hypothetical protein